MFSSTLAGGLPYTFVLYLASTYSTHIPSLLAPYKHITLLKTILKKTSRHSQAYHSRIWKSVTGVCKVESEKRATINILAAKAALSMDFLSIPRATSETLSLNEARRTAPYLQPLRRALRGRSSSSIMSYG